MFKCFIFYIGLRYIDEFLINNYEVEDYYFLQIINLIRIFPYTNDKKTEDWLNKNIKEFRQIIDKILSQ